MARAGRADGNGAAGRPPLTADGTTERGYADDHSAGVSGVQAAQLFDDEEQAEDDGAPRAQEVLPLLQEAHAAPRDEIRALGE